MQNKFVYLKNKNALKQAIKIKERRSTWGKPQVDSRGIPVINV